MARKIEVELAADTSGFEAGMKNAASSVDKLESNLKSADGAASRFDDGLGKVSDGLGTSTDKFRSTADLAGGLGDVLGIQAAGPIAAYATGFADIADGLGGLLAPALAKAKGAFIAMNATLMANPIFLVVAALAALTAAFVIAYKKSETFRKIVHGAMDGVKSAVRAMWDGVSPIIDLWKKQFQILESAVRGVVGGIRAAWNAVLGGRTIGLPSVSIPFAPDFPGFSFTIPALAKGGPATGGMPHLIGEQGPEIFVPRTSGTVIPNHAIGGGNVTVLIQTGASDLDQLIRKRVQVLGGRGPNNVQAAFGGGTR